MYPMKSSARASSMRCSRVLPAAVAVSSGCSGCCGFFPAVAVQSASVRALGGHSPRFPRRCSQSPRRDSGSRGRPRLSPGLGMRPNASAARSLSSPRDPCPGRLEIAGRSGSSVGARPDPQRVGLEGELAQMKVVCTFKLVLDQHLAAAIVGIAAEDIGPKRADALFLCLWLQVALQVSPRIARFSLRASQGVKSCPSVDHMSRRSTRSRQPSFCA